MKDNDFNIHNKVFTLKPSMTLGLLLEVQLQSLLTFSPKMGVVGIMLRLKKEVGINRISIR
jgi:hypothetical protein